MFYYPTDLIPDWSIGNVAFEIPTSFKEYSNNIVDKVILFCGEYFNFVIVLIKCTSGIV